MEPARPSSIRVLLVDDHALLTDALARLLSDEPDIEVVGKATGIRELTDTPETFDVAVVDYLLPDGNGAEATQLIKRRWPESRVVILSALVDYPAVARARRAGADAYLGKELAAGMLVDALRQVHRGTPPAYPATRPRPWPARGANDVLTARELEVLRALAEGHSTRQICIDLGVAANTVRTHVQNIIGKLAVHSKMEAVALARRNRIL